MVSHLFLVRHDRSDGRLDSDSWCIDSVDTLTLPVLSEILASEKVSRVQQLCREGLGEPETRCDKAEAPLAGRLTHGGIVISDNQKGLFIFPS